MARPKNCGRCNKPKTQCKCGRPTKFNEETIHKLREAFSMDCTDEEACCYADVGLTAFYNFQKKNPKFVNEKQLLKQKPYLLARKSVMHGVKSDPKLALEYMKLKKNKEFNTNTNVSVAGDKENPLVIVTGHNPYEDGDDEN